MKVSTDKLVVTKENPRVTQASVAAHQALVASLATHGLIQPIVVRANGEDSSTYEVIAGSRRLAAVRELGWAEVEVVENDAEYGIAELGTAENMMREAMHPLDECAVIARLVADGEDVEAVGARFGQTQRWVDQRISLIGLDDSVKQAFRSGHITMAAAQAFTLADKKSQKDYLGKAKQAFQLEAETIRNAFTKSSFDFRHALFPLEKYPKELVRADLFGDQILLDNRIVFEKLQKESIEKIKEDLLEEGWGDVVILWNGSDYKATSRYVKVEGRILKADRSKHVVLVVYSPGSGACTVDRGHVLRKDTAKVKVGKTADADTTEAGDVSAKTADDLSDTQLQIVAAYQTAGLELALSEGDVHLALQTLLGPLLTHTYKNETPWAGGRCTGIRYDNVNGMLDEKLEDLDDDDAVYRIPSRNELGEMTVNDLGRLLCNCALRSMTITMKPSAAAVKAMDAADIRYMTFDPGFLRRYRSDQLLDLAGRLKIDLGDESPGKAKLIDIICKATKDVDVDKIVKLDD